VLGKEHFHQKGPDKEVAVELGKEVVVVVTNNNHLRNHDK